MLPRSSSSSSTPSANTTNSTSSPRAALVVLEMDHEAVRDLRQLLDDAVELACAEAHASAVERRVGSSRDDAAAALENLIQSPCRQTPGNMSKYERGRASRRHLPRDRPASTASAS
jgi:hypothetical protein